MGTPATATAQGSAPTPIVTVLPGSGSATGTSTSPFVGQPVAKGVRFTKLYLRAYGSTLTLRADTGSTLLVTYSTLLVRRELDSDLDGRHTSSRLVRTL
jgi:hypothetical protein